MSRKKWHFAVPARDVTGREYKARACDGAYSPNLLQTTLVEEVTCERCKKSFQYRQAVQS